MPVEEELSSGSDIEHPGPLIHIRNDRNNEVQDEQDH